MSEVRHSDAETVVNKYLFCKRNGRQQQVNYRVCEENCSRVEKCPYYKSWAEDNKNVENISKETKSFKKPRKRRTKRKK